MTRGQIPSSRNAFSAVLGLDDQRVIIYGGSVLDVVDVEHVAPVIAGRTPEAGVVVGIPHDVAPGAGVVLRLAQGIRGADLEPVGRGHHACGCGSRQGGGTDRAPL